MNQTDRELIKVTVVFEYKSKSNEIQCSPESKMVEIAKIFSEQNRLNLNRLNFFYKSQKLDLSKTFEEIADENDKMAKKIEIKVKETENKNNESGFKKNKKLLLISLISGIILVFALIIVVLLIKKKKEKNENEIIYLDYCIDNKCVTCYNSKNSQICTKSKNEFELYNRKCAFIASYNIDNLNDYIGIFNPNKINDIYAMKTDSYIMNPYSENRFYNLSKNQVYFYLDENKNIFLSYLFKGITKLIDFSFNKNYINTNFKIVDMKGMFSGCTSLKNISFYPFIGKDLIDISYLFSDCSSLKSIALTSLNSSNIKYMSNLFYNCINLDKIEISNLDTENVIDMSSMFYNCPRLTSLNISNFKTI